MGVLGFARLAMGLAPHEPHYKDGLLENYFLKSPIILPLAEEIHRSPPYANAKRKPVKALSSTERTKGALPE